MLFIIILILKIILKNKKNIILKYFKNKKYFKKQLFIQGLKIKTLKSRHDKRRKKGMGQRRKKIRSRRGPVLYKIDNEN